MLMSDTNIQLKKKTNLHRLVQSSDRRETVIPVREIKTQY